MSETLPQVAESDISLWQNEEKKKEIRKIYGADLSETEFDIFVGIGIATGLNPFTREVWAVKYGGKAAQIFVGRDGYRKAAQKNPEYDYHLVDAVYANDEFQIQDGIIKHSYKLSNRGALLGAYCSAKRRSSSVAMFGFVELKEYNTNQSVWKDKPATMIKKVAEAQVLRMCFQNMFAGTYDESEQWEQKAAPQPRAATPSAAYSKVKARIEVVISEKASKERMQGVKDNIIGRGDITEDERKKLIQSIDDYMAAAQEMPEEEAIHEGEIVLEEGQKPITIEDLESMQEPVTTPITAETPVDPLEAQKKYWRKDTPSEAAEKMRAGIEASRVKAPEFDPTYSDNKPF
ncbi:MAG: phage recombination protein Bet [Patescibacteria group bacterium]